MIGEELDHCTSAAALRAGLCLSEDTFRRALHACIWSTIFKRKDFDLVHKATRESGNVFLIGHGLRYLYENLRGAATNIPSPIKLLCLWQSDHRPVLKSKCQRRIVKFSPDTDIILQLGAVGGYVPDLSDLIRKNNGIVETDVLYFHDQEWKLHTVPLRPVARLSHQLRDVPHKCHIVLDKMRSLQGDEGVVYLQDSQP